MFMPREPLMRRRRVIIFDEDRVTLSMMKYFFSIRGEYEILAYQEPVTCPVWSSSGDCSHGHPCADVIISDLDINKMSGIELFKEQLQRGCKIPTKNKALLSGYVDDTITKDIILLGCAFFAKPLDFNVIATWFEKREHEMDLLQPLGIKRQDIRYDMNKEITCIVPPNNRMLKGIAINMSTSGLCMKTTIPLRNEQMVTIYPDYHPNPSRAASVRWAKRADGGMYMTGLQYM
jgi:hypothetical protein